MVVSVTILMIYISQSFIGELLLKTSFVVVINKRSLSATLLFFSFFSADENEPGMLI